MAVKEEFVSGINHFSSGLKPSVSNLENILPPTLEPSVPIQVHLGLSVVFTALYGLLFLMILLQLWLILHYGHRRLSYQSTFLFVCLLWAALRTTLFSFYFKNCVETNKMAPFFSWLFFAFPVFLQYFMLNILVLYFVQVSLERIYQSALRYRKLLFLVFFLVNTVFLVTNMTSSFLYCKEPKAAYQQTITIVRVSLDYTLFFISALILCWCIIRLSKTKATKILIEGKGVSYCQAVTVCTLISLLYLSRAIYNIIAVSPVSMPTFNFGWINVSDQGEIGKQGSIEHSTNNYAFVSFGVVLFIWELLPTFTTVWLFRVRRPDTGVPSSVITSESFSSKSYFFDDPRRYDSDDDLTTGATPPGFAGLLDIPGIGTRTYSVNDQASYKRMSSYGSIPTRGSSYNAHSRSYPSPHVRGTTPPMLFSSAANSNPYRPMLESEEME
eukprot:gene19954-21908_t